MKIQSINVQNTSHVNCKSASQMTRYGVGALVASSSLFMFSNAIDSFDNQGVVEKRMINSTASALGIVGTFLGIVGIKDDEDDDDKRRGIEPRI